MKPRTSFAWVLLLAASAAASAGDAPTYHAAMAAYTDGDFATCAAILTAPLTGPKADEATIAYNAACCLARSGKPAEAFAQLDRAIAAESSGCTPMTRCSTASAWRIPTSAAPRPS